MATPLLAYILSIEGGDCDDRAVDRGWYRVQEERHKLFADPGDRVRTALEFNSSMHECDILATRSVGNKFKRVVLFQGSFRFKLGSGVNRICAPEGVKADICEFFGEDWGDGGDEFLCNPAVTFGAPEMSADNAEEKDRDIAFEFEIRERGTLPDSIPGTIEVRGRGSRGRDRGD
jgi:hypothetical protein